MLKDQGNSIYDKLHDIDKRIIVLEVSDRENKQDLLDMKIHHEKVIEKIDVLIGKITDAVTRVESNLNNYITKFEIIRKALCFFGGALIAIFPVIIYFKDNI